VLNRSGRPLEFKIKISIILSELTTAQLQEPNRTKWAMEILEFTKKNLYQHPQSEPVILMAGGRRRK